MFFPARKSITWSGTISKDGHFLTSTLGGRTHLKRIRLLEICRGLLAIETPIAVLSHLTPQETPSSLIRYGANCGQSQRGWWCLERANNGSQGCSAHLEQTQDVWAKISVESREFQTPRTMFPFPSAWLWWCFSGFAQKTAILLHYHGDKTVPVKPGLLRVTMVTLEGGRVKLEHMCVSQVCYRWAGCVCIRPGMWRRSTGPTFAWSAPSKVLRPSTQTPSSSPGASGPWHPAEKNQ